MITKIVNINSTLFYLKIIKLYLLIGKNNYL